MIKRLQRVKTPDALINWIGCQVTIADPYVEKTGKVNYVMFDLMEELGLQRNAADLTRILKKLEAQNSSEHEVYSGLREFIATCCDEAQYCVVGPVVHFVRTAVRLVQKGDHLYFRPKHEDVIMSVWSDQEFETWHEISVDVELPMPRRI